MLLTLPGSIGLFSLLQEAFRHEDPTRPCLNLSKGLHGFLDNFWWLAQDVATWPTRIAELIPDTVFATIGACDAAETGMGGIHFVSAPEGSINPFLWRQCFPPWIRRQLVSFFPILTGVPIAAILNWRAQWLTAILWQWPPT